MLAAEIIGGLKKYLIEVRLQKVSFLSFFQQPWPVFLLQILLPQNKFHISLASLSLAMLNVDFTVEFELNMVGGLLGVGAASECKRSGFKINFAG